MQVTVVKQRGASVVVQWQRTGRGAPVGMSRVMVPAEAVVDGCVDVDDLKAGVPMSVDWGAAYESHLTAEKVAAIFARLDIWTVADLEAKAIQAQKALAGVAAEDLYAMLRRQHVAE
jgi:hypothetical protein